MGVPLLAALLGYLALTHWVAATELPPLTPAKSVEVLARDGRLLRAYMVADGRWRLAAEASQVDPLYLRMLVAFEDRRFYRHAGVDPLALLRAAYQSAAARRRVSGGSTLTMQVARLLEEGGTGSWRGKLRQIRLALALERALSKREILGLYLDLAPMGGNLEGVRAGSIAWFGKEPSRLSGAEAALLVALPQSPNRRAPDLHEGAARAARARVLQVAQRSGLLPAGELPVALAEPLPSERRAFPALAPHVGDRLVKEAPHARLHLTTIDAALQASVERLAEAALLGVPPRVTVALMVADQDSGEVLASVGSGDYTSAAREGFVDMTRALRSPGSTLKPLVYGLAFSEGILHPETVLHDRPHDYGGYSPQNFDGYFRGAVTAREALQASLNLPVVAITQALGPARLLSALRLAASRAEVPGEAPGLAIALGGVGMSLEGLVQLYAAVARGGEVRPLTVRLGDDSPGAGGPPGGYGGARLMSAEASWQVTDILASAPRLGGLPSWRLAVKTGTSSGNRDALALGYSGKHVVGVWVGRADGSPVPGLLGASAATPLLFEVFARLGDPAPLPPAPPGALLAGSTAELPAHLRQFGQRAEAVSDEPQLVFPPDGAVLTPLPSGMMARVERGAAPFTWLANGAPIMQGSYEREVRLPLAEPGFVTLSVLDAKGRSARVAVEVR